VSRNGQTFKQWPQLAEKLAHAVRTHSCVLDGEVCCLNPDGRSNFKQLLFRREWPHFYAFDVLSIDGTDQTALPLLERKRRLRRILPTIETRLLYAWITSRCRVRFVRLACDWDLEGIVAKWSHGHLPH
jgi:bifunctional non-homologous end joining protein LigD